MSQNLDILGAARVNTVMSALQDQRGIPGNLAFLNRTPVVPAADGEIMARTLGHVLIADLIADGQRAATYSTGKIYLESTAAPNLKIGQALNQEQLNQLDAAMSEAMVRDNLFPFTETKIVDNLRLGVQQRMEALIIASQIGGYSYDRLGIKMSGVTFGMPADLQITPSTAWTDPTATPVNDVLVAKRIGQVKYGIVYDRLTMTLAAFNNMIATTEFQNKSRTYLAPNVSFTNLTQANTDFQRGLAQSVLGLKELEIYDSRFWSEADTGAITSSPFLPLNKVILGATMNDNDAMAIDFANGVVTESKIARLGGVQIIGQLPVNARGPVGYATTEHNPPSVTYWGVGHGFPRRHLLQATACLTIAPDTGGGSIVETIDFNEIAFS